MFSQLITRVFGSRNQRTLKRLNTIVYTITQLEPQWQQLSDNALRAKTEEFRARLAKGETLDQLLPEAFATVREASVRVLGMRHFDVQLIGGIVLHEGKIAEMGTGEGKTLVATLPTYLNALTGKGVHVVTVNDYLAKRDAIWMGPVYEFLGLSFAAIVSNLSPDARRTAYSKDITYGTNNEFGFDYLRDNMAFSPEQQVQRRPHFALVDEVDSVLIDEARTPLIISGMAEESSELYHRFKSLIPQLSKREKEDGPGDYYLDEKTRQAFLTEQGQQCIEELLQKDDLLGPGEQLYDVKHINLLHHINAALRAHSLFHNDIDYIVQDSQVVIVDEHTGRTMPGRRWSDGLHQALEAKENVQIQSENQTLASITFQNYFRLYDKLAGMTGTADTEAFEFQKIYSLEVVVVPTNRPIARKDLSDMVYLGKAEKFNAIVADVKAAHERGQPVLLGTIAIETSEKLSKALAKANITHQVLNAKFHEQEAKIISQAGRPGAVTIATNMAGRGTDIVLGGNLEVELTELGKISDAQRETIKKNWEVRHQQVIDAGGLYVLGTERHEARRIDNQLRGRCGRQGDPGLSRFYMSMEDDLLRIFAANWVDGMMRKLGLPEGEAIEHKLVNRAIERAQRKVEGHNFDIRKELLEFDDVANLQRKVIYEQRQHLLEATDLSDSIARMREDVIVQLVELLMPPESLEEQWDVQGLEDQLLGIFGLSIDLKTKLNADHTLGQEGVILMVIDGLEEILKAKEQILTSDVMRQLERTVMLQTLDNHWKEHLAAMDHLRQGIHLRGYAQKDPKQEYKRESFEMFNEMLDNFKQDTIAILSTVEIKQQEEVEAMENQRQSESNMDLAYEHATPQLLAQEGESPEVVEAIPVIESEVSSQVGPQFRQIPKVRRNDPCPCGSGKKFKQCHGNVVVI